MLGKLFRKNTERRLQSADGPLQAAVETTSHHAGDQITEDFLETREKPGDIKPRVSVHYGIPSTSSILAFDPSQSLLAIGTLDGRIKVIGGNNIEGLFVSPKQVSFKYLQFFENQGFLLSISHDDEIQVWGLEERKIVSSLQWESTLTAFASLSGSSFVYVGDEFGNVSVVHYTIDDMKLEIMPYYVPTDSFAETMESSSLNLKTVVGLLPQPSSDGNRLLIAFQDGLLVLWDISEDKIIKLKQSKDFQFRRNVIINSENSSDNQSNVQMEYEAEKEICSLCWICKDGSILAIGYDDGDIILWNLSTNKPSDAVFIQLSSNLRKLPVIVLKWCATPSRRKYSGQLFVYGGDSIGSEEVVTILSLDWSSGFETMKCENRVNLTLSASFSDMVLLTSEKNHDHTSLIMLTNPGELHYYEDTSFARHELKCPSLMYSMLIPNSEPSLTASKLVTVEGETLLATFSKCATQRPAQSQSTWPLKGGIGVQIAKENFAWKRLFIAGYVDGSVRMWDSTYPVYSLVCCIPPEVNGVDSEITKSSVSALEFCPLTLTMAIGNEIGTVRLYSINCNQRERSTTIVTDVEKKVIENHSDWPECEAVLSILKSSVCTICFMPSKSRVAVGYKSGQVAVLDITTFSVLFITDCLPSSVKYTAFKQCSDREVFFVMSSDARVAIVDAASGTALSSHLLEHEESSSVISAHCVDGVPHVEEDDLIILCCKNAILVYSLKALIEGGKKLVRNIEIKNASWSTIFKSNDYGVVLLYETGVIEIRSLRNLEVIKSTSLMELLRWNFKTNMEKTSCSTHDAHLIMTNGGEFASLSLFGSENDPKCFPRLYDHVVAAIPNKSKKNEEMKVKFSSPPFLKTSPVIDSEENVAELSIDDIEIDEPVIPLNAEEREKLYEGGSKPTIRSVEEIRAKYRKEDASTAAGRARDKLVERQEKLERIGLRTEELKNGAENFASMANELAKRMEKRKWWNF